MRATTDDSYDAGRAPSFTAACADVGDLLTHDICDRCGQRDLLDDVGGSTGLGHGVPATSWAGHPPAFPSVASGAGPHQLAGTGHLAAVLGQRDHDRRQRCGRSSGAG